MLKTETILELPRGGVDKGAHIEKELVAGFSIGAVTVRRQGGKYRVEKGNKTLST